MDGDGNVVRAGQLAQASEGLSFPDAVRKSLRRMSGCITIATHAAKRLLLEGWLGLREKLELRREAQQNRRLQVVETVALGEKRFVAIVRVREAEFLVGGGSAGVSLLARLDENEVQAEPGEQHAFASRLNPAGAEMLKERW